MHLDHQAAQPQAVLTFPCPTVLALKSLMLCPTCLTQIQLLDPLAESCHLPAWLGQSHGGSRRGTGNSEIPGDCPQTGCFLPSLSCPAILIKLCFWWPSMEWEVGEYVAAFPVYARNKDSHHPLLGLLCPLSGPPLPLTSLCH